MGAMPSHHYHHPVVRPLNRTPSAHERDEDRRDEPPPSARSVPERPASRTRPRTPRKR